MINLIRERKGPGAYIVINPHNRRIIFISQFSSLYTLTSSVSVSTAVFLCTVVVCRPHLSLWWRFSLPKEAYCHAIHCVLLHNTPTHITAPLCIAFTFYKLQKRLSCMFVSTRVPVCWCARQSGWVSSATFTDQL